MSINRLYEFSPVDILRLSKNINEDSGDNTMNVNASTIISGESYPVALKLIPYSDDFSLSNENITVDTENSYVIIRNSRGLDVEDPNTKKPQRSGLFVDKTSNIIGYVWNTGETGTDGSSIPIDDYVFEFTIAITYKDSNGKTNNITLKNSSVRKSVKYSSINQAY